MAEEQAKEEQEGQSIAQADAPVSPGDRVADPERAAAEKEAEIGRLKEANAGLEKKAASLSESLSKAIASYKAAIVRANPDVLEELISGDSIESIDETLAKGKELVSKVKRGIEAAISQTRVPVGAPERTAPDLSALSPREKIQYAIGKSTKS